MTVVRIAVSVITKSQPTRILFSNSVKTMVNYDHVLSRMLETRNLSTIAISKNLELISKEKINAKVENLKLTVPYDKPLVVMIAWLMARRKHVHKYANFYLDQGFDVLTVHVSPWQLLWPAKGTQVVAAEVLKFLETNTKAAPLFLHGFSVGGYVWSEVLVHMVAEESRYKPIVDRIVGQVWDSAADITEIPVGVPLAVFPNNVVMEKALRQYMLYHLKTFDKVATCHYMRGSQMFHTTLVKAPALFFVSKTDPVGAESSNMRVKENWENMGMTVYWHCFDKSPHVGHFQKHPKEYILTLHNFLDNLGLISNREKLQAKL